MADYVALETTGHVLLEDGTSGLLLDTQPTPLLDDFNRTENPLSQGGNWQQLWGSNGYAAAAANGTYVYRGSTNFGVMGYNVLYPADQEVQVTIIQPGYDGAPGRALWLFARLSSIASSQAGTTCYQVDTNTQNGHYDSTVRLYKWVSGTQTLLATATPDITFGAGDILRLRCVGSTINVLWQPSGGSWRNILSVTDTSIAGGGYIGLGIADGTANARYDDFSGGSTIIPSTEAATVPLTFTPSAAESVTHVYADAATAPLTFTPDGIEGGIDTGALLFKLTPGVVEARQITDSGTLPFKFTVSVSELYLPGLPAAQEAGTIYLDLAPSGIVIVEYIDAAALYLDFTVVTEHECIAHSRPQFNVTEYKRWDVNGYKHMYISSEYARWSVEATQLPVPDPC